MLPFSLVQLAAESSTLSGTLTVSDSPQISQWDNGATSWRDFDAFGATPNLHTQSRWDELTPSRWDNGATRWLDVAPGWDVPLGNETRKWVIGRANPLIFNLISATGQKLLARLWIKPPDPKTTATQARRALLAAGAAAWQANPSACAAAAAKHATRSYSSAYNAWQSLYLKHNGNPPS